MCIISVAPIPSTMERPVAAWHAVQVAEGRCSPADTQARTVASAASSGWPSSALYAVGAVSSTVTRWRAIAPSMADGGPENVARVDA